MERIYPFFSTEFYSENLVILMTVSECQRRNMDFHVDSFRLRYQGGHRWWNMLVFFILTAFNQCVLSWNGKLAI